MESLNKLLQILHHIKEKGGQEIIEYWPLLGKDLNSLRSSPQMTQW